MDVKEYELVQKELDAVYSDIMQIEATSKVVTKNIKDRLVKHQVKDPKDLIKFRDTLSEECKEELQRAKDYLQEVQPKIADIKRDIVL